MSEEIKKIIEESTTKAERLEKLDGLDCRLNDDELKAVVGGGEGTGKNGCTGGEPSYGERCDGCCYRREYGTNIRRIKCTLSGKVDL